MKCECGCGEDAPISDRTDRKRDRVKGEPLRYVHGHNRRRGRSNPDSKHCCACQVEKPAAEFYADTAKSDGLSSRCRACVKDGNRKRYASNPDATHKAAKRWRAEHPKRDRELKRRWQDANPQKRAEIEGRRRARKRQGQVERIDPFAIYERDGGRCHICAKRVKKTEMTLDHLVPISRGGDHVSTNVRLAHRTCNVERGPGRIPAQLLTRF